MKKQLSALLFAAGCLCTTVAANNWMSELPDYMRVRQMSIPGAHDAATSSISLVGKCQTLDLAGLWDAGVRAFDLRPALNNGTLTIHHGSASTGVTLEDALNLMKSNLIANPGEMAVVTMRHESEGDKGEGDWASEMASMLSRYDDVIVAFKSDLTLEEARGKIVIICRDSFSSSKVGFISGWNDNTTSSGANIRSQVSSAILYVQDLYHPDSDAAKTEAVTAALDYSGGNPTQSTWVINHTSGYVGSLGLNSNINSNAKAQNKAMLDYLNDVSKPQGKTGIVLMDHAGTDASSYCGLSLVNAIIARNNVEPGASTTDIVSFFNNKNNWVNGGAGKSVGQTSTGGATFVESYRDDAFATGTVMYADCEGVANGDYMVTVAAHANWTPNRGSIKTAMAAENATGYSQLSVNGSFVDLPVVHSTGFPSPLHLYAVPVSVTDGRMKISFDNIRQGANWFTCHVVSVEKESLSAVQDFQSNFIGWNSTTGAQNQTLKNGASELSPTTSYENWNGTPFTGKMYSLLNVPAGTYEVSLDIRSNAVDGDAVYFYANGERSTVGSTEIEHHTLTVDVTGNTLEFGVGFDRAVANWVGVDNAVVTLLQPAGGLTFRNVLSNPAYFYDYPGNWIGGEAFTGGNLAHKDNLFVESWRTSSALPQGNIIRATQPGLANGEYLVGLYAFSCFTGGDAANEDGASGLATLRVNGTEVDMPTYNNGSVPSLHEIYYVPATVDDGTLTIAVDGHGYPNWFMVDVVSVVPVTFDEPLTLALPEVKKNVVHGGLNMFASEMNIGIQNVQIQSNEETSPGEPFYENWNGTPYTGRIYSRAFVPTGNYEVSLDCFASGIGSDLSEYYMFANEKKAHKTVSDSFETLTVNVSLPATQSRSVSTSAVCPLEYGMGISKAVSQWTAVKNPRIRLLEKTSTGVENVVSDEQALWLGDDLIYNLSGICVGEGEEALGNLTPGIYIFHGKKFVAR